MQNNDVSKDCPILIILTLYSYIHAVGVTCDKTMEVNE